MLERFTERLVARQREIYAADLPFIEKWRAAWRFQEEDLDAGYSKIWMELQALSWSHPALRPRGFGNRGELGYRPDEKVCVVSVGGPGVGAHLLRRVIASFDEVKRQVPELRVIVVAGPRIDPASLPQRDGLEVVAYVHNLYRHLAACDVAVIQGGLTTAIELTASRRPFIYFPLRHHFEQNVHVAHRLDRYRAGRRMDFDAAEPDVLATAIAEELRRTVDYREVETDGARRASEKLAEHLQPPRISCART